MKDNLVVVFQGDSITDGNRDRGNDLNHIIGHGYAYMIAGKLGSKFAEKKPDFVNRGVSGDRISDLYARWNEDALSFTPNVLSILAGVNDAWRIVHQDRGGFTDRFERTYHHLLSETREVLPATKLVLCEPFILKTSATEKQFDQWKELISNYQQHVRQLAQQYNAVFVPLQDVFDDAAKRTSAEAWLWDGIHPTVAGHYLLAERWLEVVEDSGCLN
ncbi:SGNH/GDSL hydrolase family protein [Paenibacillus endoradicis]|uniref:SGNH/GDSL hydrolase family protein n=1 Tax=Paenibacillus endoradicis TaxID=2972487 RepID=UPI002159981F|nr:SGNH/GDSL hydrolase family protein [Paenibacillus endoradicis]MCR8659766.1 SGNH/GDSL hydrolase family protein [Paenibacillus endoradicis]